jgi:DNA-binding Lrp family transcriptional regulator
MVTAIVLLTVSRGRVGEVAEELASQEGISEVYSVAGRFDLVALVRVKANEDLADVVTKAPSINNLNNIMLEVMV